MANPNPSPETRFKPGQSGNPSGRSSEELKNLTEAARISSELKLKALSCLQERVSKDDLTADQALELLMSADALRLFKEAEDRAHGTPRQSIDHMSGDGSMTPKPGLDVSKLSAEALAEIAALQDESDPG